MIEKNNEFFNNIRKVHIELDKSDYERSICDRILGLINKEINK